MDGKISLIENSFGADKNKDRGSTKLHLFLFISALFGIVAIALGYIGNLNNKHASKGATIRALALDDSERTHIVTCHENWANPNAEFEWGDIGSHFKSIKLINSIDTINPIRCVTKRLDEAPNPEQIKDSLLFVGGSVVLGEGISKRSSFSEIIREQSEGFAKAGFRNVINLGSMNESLIEQHQVLSSVIKHKPAQVVYVWTPANTPTSDLFQFESKNAVANIFDRRNRFKNVTIYPFASYIKGYYQSRKDTEAAINWILKAHSDDNCGWRESLVSHVATMKKETETQGGSFKTFLFPLLVGGRGDYVFQGIHDDVKRLLKAEGIETEDLSERILSRPAEEMRLHDYNRRPNSEPHRRIAAAMMENLRIVAYDLEQPPQVKKKESEKKDASMVLSDGFSQWVRYTVVFALALCLAVFLFAALRFGGKEHNPDEQKKPQIRAAAVVALFFVLLAVVFGWKSLFFGHHMLPLDILNIYHPWAPEAGPQFDTIQNPYDNDSIDQMYAWRKYIAAAERNGAAPFWDPYTLSGSYLVGNNQSALFYPFSLLFRALPVENAFGYYTIIHLIIAAFGGFLFLKRFGLKNESAVFGALAFMFSGRMIRATNEINCLATLAWWPLVLWCSDIVVEKKRASVSLLCSLPIALMLMAGNLQIGQYCLILAFAFSVNRAINLSESEQRIRGIAACVGHFIIMAVAGMAISSVQILSVIEYLSQSTRAAVPYDQIPPTPLWVFKILLLPNIALKNNFSMSSFPFFTKYNIALYFGIATLLFAMGALFIKKRQHPRFFVWTAIVSALLSQKIFYYPIYLLVPGAKSFQLTELLCVFVICCCFSAAFMFDAIFFPNANDETENGKKRRRFGLMAAAGGIGFMSGSFLYAAAPLSYLLIPVSRLLCFSGVFFAIVGMFKLSRKDSIRGVNIFALLLIAALSVDLLIIAGRYTTQIRVDTESKPALISYLENLKSEESRIVRFDPEANVETYSSILPPNLALLAPVPDIQGYDSLMPKNYNDVVNLIEPGVANVGLGGERIRELRKHKSLASPILNMLGATHVLSSRQLPAPYELQEQSGGVFVYKNPAALPRMFFAKQALVLNSDDDTLKIMARRDFDPLSTAILSPAHGMISDKKRIDYSEARVLDYSVGYNKAWAKVSADGPALLIYTDNFIRGWKAYQNGRILPVLRVNHSFKAVQVEAGTHEILFVFRPDGLAIGVAISIICLVVYLIVALLYFYSLKTRIKRPIKFCDSSGSNTMEISSPTDFQSNEYDKG